VQTDYIPDSEAGHFWRVSLFLIEDMDTHQRGEEYSEEQWVSTFMIVLKGSLVIAVFLLRCHKDK
jgi:hypothetical protein